MIRIDMHVHSTFSDGSSSVEELVSLAQRRGISIMSLTDHDTVEGIPSFLNECRKRFIKPLSGIELSAESDVTVHILGYRFRNMQPLKDALDSIVAFRNSRNLLMVDKLRELGVDIDISEVENEARGQIIARPHFASLLVRRGYVPNIASAFSRYLAEGADAYVARRGYSPAECVSIIRRSGGLPVLAHPSLTGLERSELCKLLCELKRHGLWGLECISSHCSAEETYYFLDIAAELSLFPTAGSDFHGLNRPSVGLGVQVSENFLPWARLGISL